MRYNWHTLQWDIMYFKCIIWCFGHMYIYTREIITTIRKMNISIASQKLPHAPLPSLLSPAFHPQAVTDLRSVTIDFMFPRILHKWERTLFVLFDWLLSLSMIIWRFFCVIVWINTSFFSLLSNIPLHGHITISSFLHLLMDIWFVPTFWLL